MLSSASPEPRAHVEMEGPPHFSVIPRSRLGGLGRMTQGRRKATRELWATGLSPAQDPREACRGHLRIICPGHHEGE